jgi:hypothetical protein
MHTFLSFQHLSGKPLAATFESIREARTEILHTLRLMKRQALQEYRYKSVQSVYTELLLARGSRSRIRRDIFSRTPRPVERLRIIDTLPTRTARIDVLM